MGGGGWDPKDYDTRAREKAERGEETFAHHAKMENTPRAQRTAHQSLNPYGVKVRESRDSEEHPISTAISVWFDVTGSMNEIPVTLQKNLKKLLGLLLEKEYVKNPQILFGAVGDYTVDSVPLQVGQFESDNRMDLCLENLYLEGGGGHGNQESYELAMYFMARKTSIDCLEKRGQKGYLFIIADEIAYSMVSRQAVSDVIGDKLQADIPTKAIAAELGEKYEVYVLFPSSGTGYAHDEEHHNYWKDLFPQRLFLVDPEDIPETIASIVGRREGVYTDSDIVTHLKETGASEKAIATVKGFLSGIDPKKEIAAATDVIPGLEEE